MERVVVLRKVLVMARREKVRKSAMIEVMVFNG